MLKKLELEKLLQVGLETGADFSEIFLEDTLSRNIRVNNGEVTNISEGNLYGVGVRLLKGIDEVYGYTNDVSYESIYNLMVNLRASFNASPNKVTPLGDKKPYVSNIKIPHDKLTSKEKSQTLIKLSNIMKEYDPKIVQSTTALVEWTQNILVCNSKGIYQDDKRVYT
ncbi:MAG: DNA gyrase modulator, partial [Acholeplasmataceae bacterium]